MSKEYNGGKAGYWIRAAIDLAPVAIQLIGAIAAIFHFGRKVESVKQSENNEA